jgi:hypothetical protein
MWGHMGLINIINNMKNEITHPLERYKLIADPTIRQQAIDNFDEEFYLERKHLDSGTMQDALLLGFNWFYTNVRDTKEESYGYFTGVYAMLSKELLPEPIEEPSELNQLRTENEKLREFAEHTMNALGKLRFPTESELKELVTQAKQLLNK